MSGIFATTVKEGMGNAVEKTKETKNNSEHMSFIEVKEISEVQKKVAQEADIEVVKSSSLSAIIEDNKEKREVQETKANEGKEGLTGGQNEKIEGERTVKLEDLSIDDMDIVLNRVDSMIKRMDHTAETYEKKGAREWAYLKNNEDGYQEAHYGKALKAYGVAEHYKEKADQLRQGNYIITRDYREKLHVYPEQKSEGDK